jgi:hypothetical protein
VKNNTIVDTITSKRNKLKTDKNSNLFLISSAKPDSTIPLAKPNPPASNKTDSLLCEKKIIIKKIGRRGDKKKE